MVIAGGDGGVQLGGLLARAEDPIADPTLVERPAIADPKPGRGGQVLGDITGEGEGNTNCHNHKLD